MAKLTYIPNRPDLCFKYALEKIKKGEYHSAAVNLLSAIKNSSKNCEDYRIELAELYYTVKAYRASTDVYVKLLAEKPHIEYLVAIRRNCKALDANASETGFYMSSIKDINRFENVPVLRLSGLWSDLEDVAEDNELKIINTRERRHRITLNRIHELCEKENFDAAIALCLEIPKGSECRLEMLETLSSLALKVEDYSLAQTSAQELLELAPDSIIAYNVLAYVSKFTEYPHKVDFSELTENILTGLSESKDQEGLVWFSVFTFTMSEYELALRALKISYAINEMHVDTIQKLAIVEYAIGRESDARHRVKRGLTVLPNEYKLLFLDWFLGSNSARLGIKEAMFSIPPAAVTELEREFYGRLLICRQHSHSLDESVYEIYNVILATEDAELIGTTLFRLLEFDDEEFEKYLLRHIQSANLGTQTKCTLLNALLNCYNDFEYSAVVPLEKYVIMWPIENIPFAPIDSNGVSERTLYNAVYINLYITNDSPNKQKLHGVVKDILSVETDLKRVNVLCAVTHYRYAERMHIEFSLALIAKVYGTTVRTLERYLKVFDI